MTDPRIEAAAKAIGRMLGDENSDEYLRDTWIKLATGAMEAADAAAWRLIANCESMRPVLVLQGKRQVVAQKVMDTELSDAPVWIPVEGETNESSCGYLVYLHPTPTHCQPLPTPPAPCK